MLALGVGVIYVHYKDSLFFLFSLQLKPSHVHTFISEVNNVAQLKQNSLPGEPFVYTSFIIVITEVIFLFTPFLVTNFIFFFYFLTYISEESEYQMSPYGVGQEL